jgi:hypothetical protein
LESKKRKHVLVTGLNAELLKASTLQTKVKDGFGEDVGLEMYIFFTSYLSLAATA